MWEQKEVSASMEQCRDGEALQFKISTVIAGFPEGPEVNTVLHFWSLRGRR